MIFITFMMQLYVKDKMNKYDLEPLFVPLPSALQLTRLLNQKLTALNVLCKFWQSKMLLTNLNVLNALQMLQKHMQQVYKLSDSCKTALSTFWQYGITIGVMSKTLQSLENLMFQVKAKCRFFIVLIALPVQSKLLEMLM